MTPNKLCNCYVPKEDGSSVCFGTKEIDVCSCMGDESRCDFYADKREKALKARRVLNLFTHTDLDGVGCSVIAHLYGFSCFDSISVRYCNYDNINKEINDFLDYVEIAESHEAQPASCREILITDISMDLETAKRLDNFVNRRGGVRLALIDHHQLCDEIRNMSWAHVVSDRKECGASLLFDYVKNQDGFMWNVPAVSYFTESVRVYDTWQFDKTRETNEENLNILLRLLGADEFVSAITGWIWADKYSPIIVSEKESHYAFVESDIKTMKKYCALRNKTKKIVDYRGHKTAVVFAENYISRVGDHILTANPDIDICVVVNLPISVSLRTQRDDINVGLDIAKPLGGGGHAKAAGYQLNELPEELVKEIVRFSE